MIALRHLCFLFNGSCVDDSATKDILNTPSNSSIYNTAYPPLSPPLQITHKLKPDIKKKTKTAPSSAPTTSLHNSRQRRPLRPRLLTFHVRDDNKAFKKGVTASNCRQCTHSFYSARQLTAADQPQFCSGECRWSHNMDESDRRYYREFHDYTTTPRILHFESKHDQCATKEESGHVREDVRREQDTPIRYASDEEREHLSTLDNDSDEDDNDTSTSDGNEKENKEKDNVLNDQNHHEKETTINYHKKPL